jgi:phosphate:Na+ symporter
MLVSFVNSRLMRFRQTIGLMLGAALGTTITAQIIAFKITDYALLFVSIGLLIQIISKKSGRKEIGKAILGFGILFFGMHIMSDAMYPLRNYAPFIKTIIHLENPFLGILAGALLTALIQSSSAFIGILIILSMQGLLTLGASIPLLIGANIGTAITAVLASLNASREAKQVAIAHTLFKIIGGLLIIFFIPSITEFIGSLSPGEYTGMNGTSDIATPRQIANAHTLFNIIICLLFLPIVNSFARLVLLIYPVKSTDTDKFKLQFINPDLLVTPSLALEATKQELVGMMKKVHHMTELIIIPFIERETKILSNITLIEEEIDYLRDQISDFLILITRNEIAVENTEEAFIMMNAVREFEEIADIISGPMKDKAESWCVNEFEFSKSGSEELIQYHQMTLEILKKAIKVYKEMSAKKASKLKAHYDEYRETYFELEQQHYKRLLDENEATIGSSKTHLEIITHLKVISSHATNTSRILMYESKPIKLKKK